MCHSRVAEQIYQVTCELHMRSEQIFWATRELHVSDKQICWATHELHVSAWSDALVKCATREERNMLHVKCTRGHNTSESGFNWHIM